MNLTRSLLLLALLTSSSVLPSSINIGLFSLNTLIPSAPGSAGVNDFEIDNFTGTSDLPPDFPVSGPLSFNNSTLLLTFQDGTQQTILLGNLAPGVYTPIALQFSTLTLFSSALFTATLNSSGLPLFDGTSLQALSPAISVNLSPSGGNTLVPDTDFFLIPVAATTAVPEPDFTLVGVAALSALTMFGRRLRRLE